MKFGVWFRINIRYFERYVRFRIGDKGVRIGTYPMPGILWIERRYLSLWDGVHSEYRVDVIVLGRSFVVAVSWPYGGIREKRLSMSNWERSKIDSVSRSDGS